MINLRFATPDDAQLIATLILELAEYEKLQHEARPDAAALRQHLSKDDWPRCEALIAETAAGEAAGFALFYHNYSTFLTNWGLYLEDLYVKPAYRGHGVGFALLQRVAQLAVERRCARLEWQVLNWNDLALGFYEKLGAEPLDEWTTMRMTGEALMRLGTTRLRVEG